MNEREKKKQIIKISVFITSIFVILLSVTYAFLNVTLQGEKKQVITAGTLDLVLDEDENNLTITDALPMYDEVGMIQDAFTFRIINKTANPTNYVLKLQEINTGNLARTDVKYGLTKDAETTIDFVSNIVDNTLDSGTIAGNDTIEYSLRLWIRYDLEDITEIQSKTLSFRFSLDASQAVDQPEVKYFSYDENTPVLDTMTDSNGITYYKISNAIISMDDVLGKTFSAVFPDDSTFDIVTTEDNVTQYIIDENTYVIALEPYAMMVVGDIPIDNEYGFPPLSQGLWPVAYPDFADMGIVKFVSNLELVEQEYETVTFAGITRELKETPENMFNYTSEGVEKGTTTVTKEMQTNGIYAMEDDDATSYFYRGAVNNLVQFGTYGSDYYAYKYNDYVFLNLESCQQMYSGCSESNKEVIYPAGTPMYWKIVRINGDGTIRMIYSGTSIDASDYDVGIGRSMYNSSNEDRNHLGYTYNRTTTETDSIVKASIDDWYEAAFANTTYDDDIATSKFCSDTSGYEEGVTITEGEFSGLAMNLFAGLRRTGMFNSDTTITPTFKCPTTTETFGGSYNLKVGMLTLDEMIAAGSNDTTSGNTSFYLYGNSNIVGSSYGTMTPTLFNFYTNSMIGAFAGDGSFTNININSLETIRPVINLKSSVVFTEGTDGSVTRPFTIAE